MNHWLYHYYDIGYPFDDHAMVSQDSVHTLIYKMIETYLFGGLPKGSNCYLRI